MTESDREKFRNLLELAAKSPFDGERQNALSAAERIARRYDMSLKEAAGMAAPVAERTPPPHPSAHGFRRAAGFAAAAASNLDDDQAKADKARWLAAVQEARARGLDRDEERRAARAFTGRRSAFRKRDPHDHAHALLSETRIPFTEIAQITGLDIYQVVGMKLKMRRPLRQGAAGK